MYNVASSYSRHDNIVVSSGRLTKKGHLDDDDDEDGDDDDDGVAKPLNALKASLMQSVMMG